MGFGTDRVSLYGVVDVIHLRLALEIMELLQHLIFFLLTLCTDRKHKHNLCYMVTHMSGHSIIRLLLYPMIHLTVMSDSVNSGEVNETNRKANRQIIDRQKDRLTERQTEVLT